MMLGPIGLFLVESFCNLMSPSVVCSSSGSSPIKCSCNLKAFGKDIGTDCLDQISNVIQCL